MAAGRQFRPRAVSAISGNVLCVYLVVAVILSLASAAGAAQHGRLLPDVFPNSIVLGWGGANPIEFDKPVVDPASGLKVGDIHFDYDKFASFPDPTFGAQGGAALAGGFYLGKNIQVKDGFELHWVQTVVATKTGANVWNLPTSGAGEFPDVNSPASPIYFQENLPANVTPPAGLQNPTVPFQDFPQRFFNAGAQTWAAEAGLVAVSKDANMNINGMMFHEARVVATLRWGFAFPNPQSPFDTDDVTATPPFGWGAAQNSYVQTLNAFFDGMGGGGGTANNGDPVASGKYKFVTSTMVFVPEPASGLLMIIGWMGLARRRRGRRGNTFIILREARCELASWHAPRRASHSWWIGLPRLESRSGPEPTIL